MNVISIFFSEAVYYLFLHAYSQTASSIKLKSSSGLQQEATDKLSLHCSLQLKELHRILQQTGNYAAMLTDYKTIQ